MAFGEAVDDPSYQPTRGAPEHLAPITVEARRRCVSCLHTSSPPHVRRAPCDRQVRPAARAIAGSSVLSAASRRLLRTTLPACLREMAFCNPAAFRRRGEPGADR